MPSRFGKLTQAELKVMRDGLTGEADIDPNEDPSFPAIVETAGRLIEEIEQHLRSL